MERRRVCLAAVALSKLGEVNGWLCGREPEAQHSPKRCLEFAGKFEKFENAKDTLDVFFDQNATKTDTVGLTCACEAERKGDSFAQGHIEKVATKKLFLTTCLSHSAYGDSGGFLRLGDSHRTHRLASRGNVGLFAKKKTQKDERERKETKEGLSFKNLLLCTRQPGLVSLHQGQCVEKCRS